MNPLNVLRGGSLMTPIEDLRRDGDAVLLDKKGRFRINLDGAGRPVGVTLDGQTGEVMHYNPADGDPANSGDLIARMAAGPAVLITAPTEMSMRAAIELRQASGHPVALVEEGRLVGVCGDEEIYRGILRQTDIAAEPDTVQGQR